MRSAILLFFLLLVSIDAISQLKEFEITPLSKPEISLIQANSEFNEDALIIIYSSLTNLNFRSSMGMIDKQIYNQQSNRYEILLRPVKQILLVTSYDFIEATISTINPKAKDVFYFKVEEKRIAFSNQTVLGRLTLNSTPEGASIALNGIPVATKTPFTGELNPGPTRIQLSKAKFQTLDTIVNVQSSKNEVLKIKLMPSTLWVNITSNPSGAQVELEGKVIGLTPMSKELDLSDESKQGSRSLKVTLAEYTEQLQNIQVYPSRDPLKISIDLKKLEGKFFIESTPSGADVFIEGVYSGQTPLQGTLPFGKYGVELKMEEYATISKKQIIVNSQTTANLKQNLVLKKQPLGKLDEDFVVGELLNDASGNSYKTVKIGDQIWMAENLNTDRFQNGDLITEVKVDGEWNLAGNNNQPAWCFYNNDSIYSVEYGRLYNWYAVADTRGLCPIGWHIPSNEDWIELTDILGGDEVAGGKMKSLNLWNAPNWFATDESNFNGLPGGYRNFVGKFFSFGFYGLWWSSSEYSSINVRSRTLYYTSNNATLDNFNKQNGLSVRCLLD
jgi:uncharacterized protein (TIGR02145 family)